MIYNLNDKEIDKILEIYSKAFKLKDRMDKSIDYDKAEQLLNDVDFYTEVGTVLDEAEEFSEIFFNFDFNKRDGNNSASKIIFPLSVAYESAIERLGNDSTMISKKSLEMSVKKNKREMKRVKQIFLG